MACEMHCRDDFISLRLVARYPAPRNRMSMLRHLILQKLVKDLGLGFSNNQENQQHRIAI